MNVKSSRQHLLLLLLLLLCSFHESVAFVPNAGAFFGYRSRGGSTALLLSSAAKEEMPTELTAKQVEFTVGYLNKHHPDSIVRFVECFSEIGAKKRKMNFKSGGSFKILSAKLVTIDTKEMQIEVQVNERRRKPDPIYTDHVTISLDADPVAKVRGVTKMDKVPKMAHPVDDVVRRLNRLLWMIKERNVTGKLIQMACQIGGVGVGRLKENLNLDSIPHNRYLRQYFYDLAADAIVEGCKLSREGSISNRMKVVTKFPELNPDTDTYRIGTLLELAREIGLRLVEEKLRVRICVQSPLGEGPRTGIPKQLSGAMTLMQRMDWQSGKGEMFEGILEDYVRFGTIGEYEVMEEERFANGTIARHRDDVLLLLCPQNLPGVDSSIHPYLVDMVEVSEKTDKRRPIILLNPDLTDKLASQSQQSYRGREERMAFADSFQTIHHFENIYSRGTRYFPILGSLTKLLPTQPWVAHQKKERLDVEFGEIYFPLLASEEPPTKFTPDIIDYFEF